MGPNFQDTSPPGHLLFYTENTQPSVIGSRKEWNFTEQ